MTLYIGVDFHSHQQTVAWCDTRTGETDTFDLVHDLEQVRKFYTSAERTSSCWHRGDGASHMV